jgi:hypothetical protein
MSRLAAHVAAAALPLFGSRLVMAQSIVVSGNPAALRITAAIAGSQPTSVSNGSTTYTVVTLNPNKTYKITGQINAAMPTGLTLTASLAAPTGATSLGPVALDITARDLVTGIGRNITATRSITYQLSATALAGVVSSRSRVVMLTIVQSP